MKAIFLGLAALTIVGATSASAQGVQIGPNGVRIDDGRSDRAYRDDRRYRRDYDRDRDLTTGTVDRRGCRDVTVRERDEDGVMVTRRTRECR